MIRGITCLIVDDQFDAPDPSGMEGIRDMFDSTYVLDLKAACSDLGLEEPRVGFEFCRDAGTAVQRLLNRSRELSQSNAPVFDLVILDVQLTHVDGAEMEMQERWLDEFIARHEEGLRRALSNSSARTELRKKAGWILWSEIMRFISAGVIAGPRRLLVVSGSDRFDGESATTHALLHNSQLVVFKSKAETIVEHREQLFDRLLNPLVAEILRVDVPRARLLAMRSQLDAADTFEGYVAAVTSDLGEGWTLLGLWPNIVERSTPSNVRRDVSDLISLIDSHVGNNTPARELYRLRNKSTHPAYIYKLAHPTTDFRWIREGAEVAELALVDRALREIETEIGVFGGDPAFERRLRRGLAPLRRLFETAYTSQAGIAALESNTPAGEERLELSRQLAVWGRVALVTLAESVVGDVRGVPSISVEEAIPAWCGSFETALPPADDSEDVGSRVERITKAFCEDIVRRFRPERIRVDLLGGARYSDPEVNGACFVHIVVGHDGAVDLSGAVARIASGGGNLSRAVRDAGIWCEARLANQSGSVDLKSGRVAPAEDLAEVGEWLNLHRLKVALVLTLWARQMPGAA